MEKSKKSKKSGSKASKQASESGDPYEDYTAEEMGEYSSQGWAPIHHAAQQGLLTTIERVAGDNKPLLELKTGDTKSTPLLLAAAVGNLTVVRRLIELGSRPDAVDAKAVGVVEICVQRENEAILRYLACLDHEKLNFWKRLAKLLRTDFDEDAEHAARCFEMLMNRDDEADSEDKVLPTKETSSIKSFGETGSKSQVSTDTPRPVTKGDICRKSAVENGLVAVISNMLRSEVCETAKSFAFRALLRILKEFEESREQAVSSGIAVGLTKMLGSSSNAIVEMAAEGLKILAGVKLLTEEAPKQGVYAALVEAANRISTDDDAVLASVVDTMGVIGVRNETLQGAFGAIENSFGTLVRLYHHGQSSEAILVAVSSSIAKLSRGHADNQCRFVAEGALKELSELVKSTDPVVQLEAVEAVASLLSSNRVTQRYFLESNMARDLLKATGPACPQAVRDKAARALWDVASFDMEKRRQIAELMGGKMFVEFLFALSDDLQRTGCQGIGFLAQLPVDVLTQEQQTYGVQGLMRLLESEKEEDVMIEAMESLRALFVGAGFVPRKNNQVMLIQLRGLKTLTDLIEKSKFELIQVEAAHTIAAAALGNSEILAEIGANWRDYIFDILGEYLDISENPTVRLNSGSALAMFAYNNPGNQKAIASRRSLRFEPFQKFMSSEDRIPQCKAAFQVVVLAPLLTDEQPAVASAAGIKLITDQLQRLGSPSVTSPISDNDDDVTAATTDFIARLSHVGAGVPSALIAVSAVDHLCNLLVSPIEQVRGSSAMALGYFSYNHHARRKLLNRCRIDPGLMIILKYYQKCTTAKLSPDFLEDWKHYKRIGLPSVDLSKLPITNRLKRR